jgi:hypothetical protein
VARMGEGRFVYRVLVGRPKGKRPLGRPRRRWEDNIKMDKQASKQADFEDTNPDSHIGITGPLPASRTTEISNSACQRIFCPPLVKFLFA